MTIHIQRPSPKSLFSQECLKNCKFMRQKKRSMRKVTYLHEARPPIAKDITEDSPTVLEKAIKAWLPHCAGGRGTWVAGKGAAASGRQPSFMQGEEEEGFASSSQLQLHCAALQVRGSQRGWAAGSSASCKFSQGVSLRESSPPPDV